MMRSDEEIRDRMAVRLKHAMRETNQGTKSMWMIEVHTLRWVLGEED